LDWLSIGSIVTVLDLPADAVGLKRKKESKKLRPLYGKSFVSVLKDSGLPLDSTRRNIF